MGPKQDAGSWQEDPGATHSTLPCTPLRGGGGVTRISTNDGGVLDHVIHKCHVMLHDICYRRGWGPDVIGSQGTRLCSHGKAFFSTSGPGTAILLRGMEWCRALPYGTKLPQDGRQRTRRGSSLGNNSTQRMERNKRMGRWEGLLGTSHGIHSPAATPVPCTWDSTGLCRQQPQQDWSPAPASLGHRFEACGLPEPAKRLLGG